MNNPDNTCCGLSGRAWAMIVLMIGGTFIIMGKNSIQAGEGSMELIIGLVVSLGAILYAAQPAKTE
jgi:hypothetical protein